jgi:hypothetical protein
VDIVLRCIATSAVSPNSDHALGLRIAIGRDPHDEELIRRKGAGTIYLYGARANADKKVSRRFSSLMKKLAIEYDFSVFYHDFD